MLEEVDFLLAYNNLIGLNRGYYNGTVNKTAITIANTGGGIYNKFLILSDKDRPSDSRNNNT